MGRAAKRQRRTLGEDSVEHSASNSEYQSENEENANLSAAGNIVKSNHVTTATPNSQDVRLIKEAAELYQSNTFKLKIDALLPNVRPKKSVVEVVEQFLHELHGCLSSLSSTAPQHPVAAAEALLKCGISVPYPHPTPSEQVNWKVSFEKPQDIVLVGSWANSVAVQSKHGFGWGIDIALEIPDSVVQEKDYLNYRFFHKRAYYLASIASGLKESTKKLGVNLHYECASGDSRQTTLVLTPKDGKLLDKKVPMLFIRLLPTLSSSSPIPIRHLSPAQNNVRTQSLNELPSDNCTPLYNSALQLCYTPRNHLLSVHHDIQEVPAYRDALTLLRIWANQRGYCVGSSNRRYLAGFEAQGMLWCALLSIIVSGGDRFYSGDTRKPLRPIGRGISSYQLFKSALNLLSTQDFTKEVVALKTKNKSPFPLEQFANHHEASLLDWNFYNLLSGIPSTSLDLLTFDASVTLQTLDHTSGERDTFTETFLQESSCLSNRFDAVLRLNLSGAKIQHMNLFKWQADYQSESHKVVNYLCRLLRLGLGDRTKAIGVFLKCDYTRPLKQSQPSAPSADLLIGLTYNTDQAFRLVDYGPPASSTESETASDFSLLWGSRCELRRFKDGRIQESVVWDVKDSDQRAGIPAKIVEHLVHRHLAVSSDACSQLHKSTFDERLKLPKTIAVPHGSRASPSSQGFKAAMNAFDALVKAIKSTDDEFPLSLLNVSPVSDRLRYTSVYAPTIHDPLSKISIVLEFEHSSKWPQDFGATQKLKLALMELLGDYLSKKVDGVNHACVTISDVEDAFAAPSFLEIEYRGWIFQAFICHSKEFETTGQTRDTDGSPLSSFNYRKLLIHSPRHHRAIATLAHRYPAYPGTVRLVKRWLSSHWLLGKHISPEAVELLCAYVFLLRDRLDDAAADSSSVCIPGSKELGFFRVMELLMDWKWEDGLDFSFSSRSDSTEIQAKIPDSHGVWCIKTDLDSSGKLWTASGPNKLAALRVKALSKASLTYLTEVEKGDGAGSIDALFEHPLDDYDFVIHLSSSFGNQSLPRSAMTRHLHTKLQKIYANSVIFFSDDIYASSIGGVWIPDILKPRQFRVLAHHSSQPCNSSNSSESETQLNKHAVLHEIQRIGGKMVDRIELLK